MTGSEKEMLALMRRAYEFLVGAELGGPLAPEAEQVKALAPERQRVISKRRHVGQPRPGAGLRITAPVDDLEERLDQPGIE